MQHLVQCHPSDRVLFLAEGNFSFSRCLVDAWLNLVGRAASLPSVVATCFEPSAVSKSAEDNVKRLRELGVQVAFGVDATRPLDASLKPFTKVIFMFPHVGGKSKIHLNRALIRAFAENMSGHQHLSDRATVVVCLCAGQGGTPFDPVHRDKGNTWQVVNMMAFGDLALVDVGLFHFDCFPDYRPFGHRGQDRGFHAEQGVVHVFKRPPVSVGRCCQPRAQLSSLEQLQQLYVEYKLSQWAAEDCPLKVRLRRLLTDMKLQTKDQCDTVMVCVCDCGGQEAASGCIPAGGDNDEHVRLVMTVHFSLGNWDKCPAELFLMLPGDGDARPVIDLTKEARVEVQHWSQMWLNADRCLYPELWTHDLAFTYPDGSGPDSIPHSTWAALLWTLGQECVTDFQVIDQYRDPQSHALSNTVRIRYQSHVMALSRTSVWTLHYHLIGHGLASLYGLTLR